MKFTHKRTNNFFGMAIGAGERTSSSYSQNDLTMKMTIYLAWAVRVVLLVLYIPVQLMATVVRLVHRLDLWASGVVMQSAKQPEIAPEHYQWTPVRAEAAETVDATDSELDLAWDLLPSLANQDPSGTNLHGQS